MNLPNRIKLSTLAMIPALCLIAYTPAQAAVKHPHFKVTQAQAEQIALKKESGKIKSAEVEHENGRWIYSFDVQHGTQVREVNVDANTGKVVEDSLDNGTD